MKRILMVLAMVFALAAFVMPAFAATNVNVNDSTSNAGALAEQQQSQGQGQGQFGYVNYQSPPNFLQIPQMIPVQPVLIPGGIVDITNVMPNVGIKQYAGEEVIAVKVQDGNVFDRIRLQDAPVDLVNFRNTLVNMGWDLNYTRIQVFTRSSSSGVSIGGGAQAGAAGLDPTHGTAGMASASILPSYARSTADPRFTLIAYLLKGAPVKKASVQQETVTTPTPAALTVKTPEPTMRWGERSTVPAPRVPVAP